VIAGEKRSLRQTLKIAGKIDRHTLACSQVLKLAAGKIARAGATETGSRAVALAFGGDHAGGAGGALGGLGITGVTELAGGRIAASAFLAARRHETIPALAAIVQRVDAEITRTERIRAPPIGETATI